MISDLQKKAYHLWNLERGLTYPNTQQTLLKKLYFFFEATWEPKLEERELLSKIAQAVGFSADDILALDSFDSTHAANAVFLAEFPTDNVSSIHHPRLMLQNPGLKKNVWEKLKKKFINPTKIS